MESSLLSSSKELYEKCENTGNVTFAIKANSLHRMAGDRRKQVETLDEEVAQHLTALKQ